MTTFDLAFQQPVCILNQLLLELERLGSIQQKDKWHKTKQASVLTWLA